MPQTDRHAFFSPFFLLPWHLLASGTNIKCQTVMETWDVQELRNIEDFKFSTTIQLAFVPCTHIFVGMAKMTAQLGQMSSLYIYRQEVSPPSHKGFNPLNTHNPWAPNTISSKKI
jgi:hypothetical protein